MDRPVDLEMCFGASNYAPMPVTIVRGQGVHLWDENGRRYIDMMGAYSAASFGHCHPRLVQALVDQAQQLDTISRAYFNDRLGVFLARACALTGMDSALPMNSGAEAVETALKAARKWGYKVKGVPADRAEIIGEHPHWLTYDLPADLLGIALGGRYRGQRQRWFALRFLGEAADIRLDLDPHPEFDAWRWVALTELPALAVPFKRPIYDILAASFAAFAR